MVYEEAHVRDENACAEFGRKQFAPVVVDTTHLAGHHFDLLLSEKPTRKNFFVHLTSSGRAAVGTGRFLHLDYRCDFVILSDLAWQNVF